MAWHTRPLPVDTWGYGGVVPKIPDGPTGFFFADFRGDHAVTVPHNTRVEAADIDWWDNSLTLPPVPGVRNRTGASSSYQGD